jgi:aminoglycoside 2'-N-acetyltransferase I
MTDSTARVVLARTADLPAALRRAIVLMCTEAHGTDFSHLFTYLPDDGLHALVYLGPELASHGVITTRWMQPEGSHILRTAYVDAVTTAVAHQRRGLGRQMMRSLAGAADAEGYEIAGLQSDAIEFYARLGWERWRGPLAGRGRAGLIPTPDERGVMILRLSHTPPLNLDRLLTVEEDGRIW